MIRNNNPDLKWETRATWNLGADLGLWNNRLVLTAEYYYSKTTDMLYAYDVPVPPFAYDKLLANIGSMSNQGLELGFSITPIQKKDIELNINMNLAWQKNKLLSLSGEYDGMQILSHCVHGGIGRDAAQITRTSITRTQLEHRNRLELAKPFFLLHIPG